MSENSKIEWTDHTFNPWEGCTKVSPGCANCYAETLVDKRYGRVKWGKGNPRRRTSAANWKQPLRWNRSAQLKFEAWEVFKKTQRASEGDLASFIPPSRPRVFCASLADWLDDEVPAEWLADLLARIHATPFLDWLLLTKRPENFVERTLMAGMHLMGYRDGDPIDDGKPKALATATESVIESVLGWSKGETFPANVWVGTSVEDRPRLKRVQQLREIPAKVHFLSCEPLLEDLGAIDFANHVEWVIIGGESGPGARPMNVAWARSLVQQCRAAGVAPFVKQLGSRPYWENADARSEFDCGGGMLDLCDKKGGAMSEWPEDLRVREFPV